MLLPAIIVHLLDVKANNSKSREKSTEGLHQCMQVVHRLREMYASANFAVFCLQVATRKINLRLPPGPTAERHGGMAGKQIYA